MFSKNHSIALPTKEPQGNIQDPKLLSISVRVVILEKEKPWEPLKGLCLAVSLGKDHGQQSIQSVWHFRCVFHNNQALPPNK